MDENAVERTRLVSSPHPQPRTHLADARKRQGWSQRDLADLLGTTQVNVSRWERGLTTPTLYFRRKLIEVLKQSASDLELLPQECDEDEQQLLTQVPQQEPITRTLPHSASHPWNIPYHRNLFFTGREEILARLHHTFHVNTARASVQVQALSGLGGVGKTQIAIEYAYRFHQDYTAVLWLRAETSDILIADILRLARVLGLPESNEQHQQYVIEGVKRWLSIQKRWLLILDNVEKMSIVQEILPVQVEGRGHTLVTTRAQVTGIMATRIEVEPLPAEEGVLFLLRRAKFLAPDASLQQASGELVRATTALAQELGGLPLALDQAGTYMEETGCRVSDYLDRYQQQRRALLDLRGACGSHPLSVQATLSLCIEQVEHLYPDAVDVLRLCAFLHPDAIQEELCAAVVANTLLLDTAFAALRTGSLLRRHHEARTVSMHRLVQAVVKDTMSEQTQRCWAERAVCVVNQLFPAVGDVQHFDRWPQCQAYLPHALVATQLIEQWGITSIEAYTLLHNIGLYFLARADYAQAKKWLQQARDHRVLLFGELHADVAESLNALGDVAYYQGNTEQAERLLCQALQIREQVLEAQHPDIASNLNKLARLYQDQGKYQHAEPLLQRALSICEVSLGPDHLEVANMLNSLGFLYRRQGRLLDAEPLLQRALSIYEQALGPEHPDTIFSLTYLAALFYDQGKYTQAYEYYHDLLTMCEYVMGPEHPRVATGLNDLARVLRVQGKYAEAEPLFHQAVAIYEQTLGAEHHYVATSLTNLAVLYQETGRVAEAVELLQQAKMIYEKALGPDHPRIAQCTRELALLQERREEVHR